MLLTACTDPLDAVYNPNTLSEDLREIQEHSSDSIKNNIHSQIKYSLRSKDEIIAKTYEEILSDYNTRQIEIADVKERITSTVSLVLTSRKERAKVLDSIKSLVEFEIIEFKQWKSDSWSSYYTYATKVKVTLPDNIAKVVASYYPSVNGEHLFFESDKSWRNKTYTIVDKYNDFLPAYDVEDISHSLYIDSIITKDGEDIYAEDNLPKVEGYSELKELSDKLDELGGFLSNEELNTMKHILGVE